MAAPWDQIADLEEGDDSDFDTVSPDWDQEADGEEGDETDWDLVTENGSATLNVAMGAAKNGSYGWELTADGTNTAYGDLTGPTAETLITMECWIDPNSLSMQNGQTLTFMTDDAIWGLAQLYYTTAGGYYIRGQYKQDAPSYTLTTNTAVTDGWHHVRIITKGSSAPGADDGYFYIYLDGELIGSATGLDNDTMSVATARFGLQWTGATLSGSFYLDDCKWSDGPGSPPWITEAAAQEGSYGMAITVEDTTARYGELSGPIADTEFTIDFQIDPNSLTMATNDIFTVALANGEIQIDLCFDGTNYEIRATANTDGGTDVGSRHDISDAWTHIRIVWKASSGAGNDDGWMYLYIDDALQEVWHGIDSDTLSVDEVRYGAVANLDSGTSGVFYMDLMQWHDSLNQQAAAGTITPAGALSRAISLTTLAGTLTPAGALTRKTLLANLAGAITPAGALVRKTKKQVAGLLTPTSALFVRPSWLYVAKLALIDSIGTIRMKLDEAISTVFREGDKTG